MADFVAVLRKTLDGLNNPPAETRQRVYERARATIISRIDGMNPPPPASVREMQLRALDDAVRTVEQSYAPRKPLDPLDELEDVFRSLNGLMNQPTTPAPKPAATATTPRPATTPAAPRPASQPLPSRAPLPERPPLSERPRVEPPVRREQPLGDAQRPLAGTRPAEQSQTPIARAPLPPLREPSRPVPAPPAQRPVAAPAPESLQPAKDDFDDFDFDRVEDDTNIDPLPLPEPPRRPEPRRVVPVEQDNERRGVGFGKIAAVILGIAALGGAGYGVWLNKDDFSQLVGLTSSETPPAAPETPAVDTAQTPPAETPTAPEAAAETSTEAEAGKLTQRLNEDGSEVDMGPAAGEPAIGEGTSVAAATQPSEPPVAITPPPATPSQAEPSATDEPAAGEPGVDPATAEQSPPEADIAAAPAVQPVTPPVSQPATPASVPGQTAGPVAVAQKAIFYEERTSSAQGSAEPGTTVWSLVQESPGGGRPPEAAIRGVISVPERDIGISMTIRRNADPTLPASHIIEMIFITPDNFAEGSVDNILRVALKSDEQQPGSPVIGLPAKIGDGFFLVALNNSKAEIDANMNLLQRQNWLDIAFVYKSGRRALITMEKGVPGEKVFSDAMKAWGVASSG